MATHRESRIRSELNLRDLLAKRRWAPRAAFPPSIPIGDRIFGCEGGLYLLTNPRRGPGDPVRAVGWAESDYWAKRFWDNPPFSGDLTAPPRNLAVPHPSHLWTAPQSFRTPAFWIL